MIWRDNDPQSVAQAMFSDRYSPAEQTQSKRTSSPGISLVVCRSVLPQSPTEEQSKYSHHTGRSTDGHIRQLHRSSGQGFTKTNHYNEVRDTPVNTLADPTSPVTPKISTILINIKTVRDLDAKQTDSEFASASNSIAAGAGNDNSLEHNDYGPHVQQRQWGQMTIYGYLTSAQQHNQASSGPSQATPALHQSTLIQWTHQAVVWSNSAAFGRTSTPSQPIPPAVAAELVATESYALTPAQFTPEQQTSEQPSYTEPFESVTDIAAFPVTEKSSPARSGEGATAYGPTIYHLDAASPAVPQPPTPQLDALSARGISAYSAQHAATSSRTSRL